MFGCCVFKSDSFIRLWVARKELLMEVEAGKSVSRSAEVDDDGKIKRTG